MDYEKKYKEALEKARQLCAYPVCKPFISDLQDLFTELKESEDEKTKRLLHTIANKMSQHLRDIFTEEEFQCFDAWSNAWLEKHCEQKQILDVEIPFGAKDSELEEVSYNIPNGYHAEIDGDKVVIKRGEKKPWSEEDENLLKLSLENLTELKDRFGEEYGKVGNCIVWFESLKGRYAFKPSKEQLNGLKEAIEFLGCTKTRREQLQSLYEQLKKLREG